MVFPRIQLKTLRDDQLLMFKLTLPDVDDFYEGLVTHPSVARVVALSGGYNRATAVAKLALQHGVIASFSRGEKYCIHDVDPIELIMPDNAQFSF